jgi:hypothetical protein
VTKIACLSGDGHVGRNVTSLNLSATQAALRQRDFTGGRVATPPPIPLLSSFLADEKFPWKYQLYMGQFNYKAKWATENAVFCDVTTCGSCKNRRLLERIAFIIRVTWIDEIETTLALTSNWSTLRRSAMYIAFLRSVLQLPILVILMIEAIRSSGTSVLTRATRHHIPVDGNLHSHLR